MTEIRIRQARVFFTVAETRSVTKAARALNRAQTSITKSMQNLERAIDTKLVDRSSKGVELTPFGELLLKGVEQALQVFASAAQLMPPILIQQSPGAQRFLSMDVSETWLNAFLATVECKNVTVAAARLSLSAAAVSSSIRKFEDSLDSILFERTPFGIIPTTLAEGLVRHIKLAKHYLCHAVDEIDSLKGNQIGRIMVGSLPFVRSIILPSAITSLLLEHPNIDVSTTESPYDDLISGLRCGDVDFLVGALRNEELEGLVEEPILKDHLSIIVRRGHPLEKKRKLGWQDLTKYPWILPRKGTPTRTLFHEAIMTHGLDEPDHVIETSSFVMLRGILLNSDRVTMLSKHQVYYEDQFKILTALSFELPQTKRWIGFTHRARGTMSPGAQLLMQHICSVVKGLGEFDQVS